MIAFLDIKTGTRFTLDSRRAGILELAIIANKPPGIASRLMVTSDPIEEFIAEGTALRPEPEGREA